jgi:hypothetical protein
MGIFKSIPTYEKAVTYIPKSNVFHRADSRLSCLFFICVLLFFVIRSIEADMNVPIREKNYYFSDS